MQLESLLMYMSARDREMIGKGPGTPVPPPQGGGGGGSGGPESPGDTGKPGE